MKVFTNILESLEIDKNLDKQLIESVERYGETPESGTAFDSKFEPEDNLKVNSGESNNGGTGKYEPGEKPESGTADSAKFEPEDKTKSGDAEVEEIKKEPGEGEQEYGKEPDQSIEGTGKELKENSTEEHWDATEIARKGFKALLKFNFGKDAKGNNYIITNDNNEVERFFANTDEEAKAKFNGLKEDDHEEHEPTLAEVLAKLGEEEAEAVEHYTKAIANLDLSDEDKAKVEEILKDEKDHLGLLQIMLTKNDGIETDEVKIEEPAEDTVETPVEDTVEEPTEVVEEDEEVEDKPEETEEHECVEPATIVIDNDNNEVTLTFNEKPCECCVEEAVKKFCGEEFFTTLEPVADEENELVYKFTVKELNKDEDVFAEADALETEE